LLANISYKSCVWSSLVSFVETKRILVNIQTTSESILAFVAANLANSLAERHMLEFASLNININFNTSP